jgi:hypothetical protein
MATCNNCRQEYWLDYKNHGAKMELDKRTPHRCVANTTAAAVTPSQTERERKIEELALLKIDALNAIAYSIHELAEALAHKYESQSASQPRSNLD